MVEHPDRGVARVRLGDEQVAWLSDRPHAAHEVRPHPYCDLEAGHPDPHEAIGQRNRVEWWIRWTLDGPE